MSIASELNKPGIYKIISKINGRIYYGSAQVSFKDRWNTHKKQLKRNIHSNKNLQNTYNSYGYGNLEFTIMFVCPPDQCLYWEQILLDMWWDNGKNCFNVSKDAIAPMKGRKASPETIAKRAAKMTGENNPNYGKKFSAETCEKISIAQRGRKISEETRKKRSIALSGKNNPNYNKKASQETREKQSKAHIGKKQSVETIAKRTAANTGKKRSAETKAILSQKKIGAKNPNYGKPAWNSGKSWKMADGKMVWFNKEVDNE